MSLKPTKIPLSSIPQFSKRDLSYIREDADLREFYKYPVDIAQFENIILDKAKDQTDRQLLIQVLEEQYLSLSENQKVNHNIKSLSKDNCFTVVTAHQPTIFTGPLYYIYKILSTIKLAEELRKTYPTQQFVPVFVSGAEDHDFEEVQQTLIFGKPLTWENQEKGSVGKMSTKSLVSVLEQLETMIGDRTEASKIVAIIKKAYQGNSTYGIATVELVHELFKDFGLVVLDMSTANLKRAAIPLFKKELLSSPSINLVEETQQRLNEKGFKAQATARDINLFYLGGQYRERIVREGDIFKVLNTTIEFSETEILAELQAHPERFSPNVIMRPLYQELILPNLAYIGGGGEIAYWLERKTQFEHFELNFPMLIRRCSALIVSKADQKKRNKLGLSISDLFTDPHQLVKQFLQKNTESNLNLAKEKEAVSELFQGILAKAKAIDVTLEGAVKAEESKQLKSLQQMEGRFMKAEKRNQELTVSQINKLKDKLFPSNSLQERKVNFLSFYGNVGESFFEEMKEILNPLEKMFVVFEEV